ncbi:MAG: diguanylate cyclase [Acidimicrobiaceae bacterium]
MARARYFCQQALWTSGKQRTQPIISAMATRGVLGAGPLAPERLAIVENLMANNPDCAVGVFGPARHVADSGQLLEDMGIPVGGHPTLKSSAIVQFVATSDAWLVSDLASEATLHGSARRAVRLRNGRMADLHLVDVSDTEVRTVVIIVPYAGDTVAPTPPPTAIVASPRVGVIHCDGFGVITTACDSTLALLRQPPGSLVGGPILHQLHPADHEAAIVNWVAGKEQPGVALRWRCRVVRADGSPLWVEATLTNEIDATGAGDVRIDLYDISQEVAATEALAAETELLALLTESLPVGVAKFDARGHIEHANRRLTQLLAPTHPEELLGRAVRGELEAGELGSAFRALVQEGAGSLLVVDHVGSDGVVRHLEWTIRPVRSDAGAVTGGVVCIADVTEAGHLRIALEHRARTDALTGCLNRAGTIAALEGALANVEPGEGIGLLFIDLDGFKHINDASGHAIGDVVLEIVASRLRDTSRQEDLLGRLGGDEFVVIAPRLESAAAALVLANRISTHLQGVAAIGELSVAIAASIGVAWTATGKASDLLAHADAAMYEAKQAHSTLPVLAPA